MSETAGTTATVLRGDWAVRLPTGPSARDGVGSEPEPPGTGPGGPGPDGLGSEVLGRLLAAAPVGVALVEDGLVAAANPALAGLLGLDAAALRGRPADSLLHRDEAPLLARPTGVGPGRGWTTPPRALDGPAGTRRWCRLHVSSTTGTGGRAAHLVVFSDVTESRRAEESLRHRCLHDELTGLPNRRALTGTLERLVAGPTARRVAVLFCDLDAFTRVNDSLGHEAGDELLRGVATRLRARLPAACGLVRLSGDEFAVVCADAERHGGLAALAGVVSGALRTAVAVRGQLVRISATVGAAVGASAGLTAGAHDGTAPATADDAPELDPVSVTVRRGADGDGDPTAGTGAPDRRAVDLMRFADAALAEAKSAGTGRVALADEAIMRGADEGLALESRLREALTHDGLVLHYQPVIGPDGHVTAAEALVRWPDPQRGLLMPDTFLPVAARADMLGELDRWVLRTATARAARWPAPPGRPAPAVAVNLAGLVPGDPAFLPTVRAALADAGLAPERLVLELVETRLADLPAAATEEMSALVADGVRFAVDDFGTGYSSLSRLTGLPAQIVKLDRSFVRHVATGEDERAVARAVVDLTRALGRTCVAEGVEDCHQLAVLRDLGVAAYQGWLFARAVPADALAELVAGGPVAPRPPRR